MMKIQHLHIQNFQGARAVDLPITTPAVLFCGPNGAGKSSVGEAIKLAIAGSVERVSKKKDYEALVSEGAKSAQIIVDTDAGQFSVKLPAGKRSGAEATPALAISLDGQQFAKMEDAQRRSFLFHLCGVKTDREAVAARMTARGLEQAKVDAVMPLLRSGFAAAHTEAQTKATEARGAWKAITGENYGVQKAQTWGPPATPTYDAKAHERALQAEQDQRMEVERLIGLQSARAQWERTERANQERAEALREKVATRERVQSKLALDRAELAAWEPKLAAVQAAAAPRVGLVHDLARAVQFLIEVYGGELYEHADVLSRYEAEYGRLAATTEHDDKLAAKLDEYERAVALYRSAVANGERDLAAIEAAQAELAQLAERAKTEAPAPVDDKEVADARAKHTQLRDEITRIAAAQVAAKNAGELVGRASQHHRDVSAWSAIAEALAPDGIPGELLAAALGPFNAALAKTAQLAGWQAVVVGADMSVSYGGRAYPLLSESEQWRVDAMVAQVVATMSGTGLLLLDRMDVIQPGARGDVLGWIEDLTMSGQIATAILCATLKAPPDLGDHWAVHWIERGEAALPQREALGVAA